MNITEAKLPLKPTMGALRVLCAHMTNTNWKGEKLDTYLPQVRIFLTALPWCTYIINQTP